MPDVPPPGADDVNEPNTDGPAGRDLAGPEQQPQVEATDPWQQAIDNGWGAPWVSHPWNAHSWQDDQGWGRGQHEWRGAEHEWGSKCWSQGSWESKASWPSSGILSRRQLQEFHTAEVPRMGAFGDTTAGADGGPNSRRQSWTATGPWEAYREGARDGLDNTSWNKERPSEKLAVPDFEGTGNDEAEVGKSARSYIRKVQVWLRCTRLPPEQRALALYNALHGRAWVYAEELDLDVLASSGGVTYFLEWVQTRFAEVELNKISQVMGDLFKRFRRKADQTMRDYIVEFERLLLRLQEIQCELPNTVKAWLFIDKLRLSEAEELALLASVGNQWCVKQLQQAALLQERSLRKPSGDSRANGWRNPGHSGPRWSKNSVHMTAVAEGDEDSDAAEDEAHESDSELVPEEVALDHHTAYVAYQTAKDKYKAATQGRGTDPSEVKKRAEERLRLAKSRSFCSVCKRKGHWHRDEICPLRGKTAEPGTAGGPKSAHECHAVHVVHMTSLAGAPRGQTGAKDAADHERIEGTTRDYLKFLTRPGGAIQQVGGYQTQQPEAACEIAGLSGDEPDRVEATGPEEPRTVYMTGAGCASEAAAPMLAIIDTACTKTVAGHDWYESYCELAAKVGFSPQLLEVTDNFKFGASRTHRSHFAVRAWFALGGKLFQTDVAVVPCSVPLLLSRPALSALGLIYDVGGQKVSFTKLAIEDLPLEYSATGHPAVSVDQFLGKAPPVGESRGNLLVWVPEQEAYMAQGSGVDVEVGCDQGSRLLFYPKKVSLEVQAMLEGPWESGGQSFLAWWNGADQSRDFWVETASEMIRVHVTPRKYLFVPSKWNTQNTELKHALLNALGGTRITEHLPCLSEGSVLLTQTDQWQESCRELSCGLWVGRSRFSKAFPQAPSTLSPAPSPHGLGARLGMEDEEGRHADRTSGVRGGVPCSLDGARAEEHVARTAASTCAHNRGRPDEGDHQADAGRAGDPVQGCQRAFATEADEGRADCLAPDGHPGTGGAAPSVREVPGMDVQGDTSGLPTVGPAGSGSEPESSPRPRGVRFMGKGRGRPGAGEGQHGSQPGDQEPEQRPGDQPEGACAEREGIGGWIREQLRGLKQILGPSEGCRPEGELQATPGGGGRSQRPGGGDRPRSQGGDCRDRGEARGPEAEAQATTRTLDGAQEEVKAGRDQEVGNGSRFGLGPPPGNLTCGENGGDCSTSSRGDGKDYEPSFRGAGKEYEPGSGAAIYITDGARVETDGEDEPTDEVQAEIPRCNPAVARERARAGIRRRRREAAGPSKRALGGIKKVFNAMVFYTTAVAAHTAEVLAGPLQDAWSVCQSSHYHEDPRADFLELFAGKAKISQAVARLRGAALEPCDLRYGHDLCHREVQETILRQVAVERPRLIWVNPPALRSPAVSCDTSSPQALRRDRQREECMLEFLDQLFRFQQGAGGHIALQNPRASDLWRHPVLQRWAGDASMTYAEAELLGTCGPGRLPVLCGVSVLTSCPVVAKAIHQQTFGEVESHTAATRDFKTTPFVPFAFAKAVAKAAVEAKQRLPQEVLAAEGEPPPSSSSVAPAAEATDPDEPLGANSISWVRSIRRLPGYFGAFTRTWGTLLRESL